MTEHLRIGIIGAGANTRQRHIPGFRELENVEIAGVVNRTAESSRRVAQEFNIPKVYCDWQELIDDDAIDAVLVGTWPYLHAPVAIASLRAGKHVLTEARMALNAAEAHAMLLASVQRPDLVAMIVPSPLGFRFDSVILRMLAEGFLGELRELVAIGADDTRVDAHQPLHWRQVERYSGLNTLQLGILHETLTRWVPDPVRVLAQTQTFVRERIDPLTHRPAAVETPDSVHVLTRLPNGAQGLYHVSGVSSFGPGSQIHLYGTEGTLKYEMAPQDRLWAGRRGEEQLLEISIDERDAYGWRVETEFVGAIRGQEPVRFTDFAAGVRYMEFTEAVAISAAQGRPVALPLES